MATIYRSDSAHQSARLQTSSQAPLHSAAELAALTALKRKGATVCLAASSLSHRRRPDDDGGSGSSNDPSLSVGQHLQSLQ